MKFGGIAAARGESFKHGTDFLQGFADPIGIVASHRFDLRVRRGDDLGTELGNAGEAEAPDLSRQPVLEVKKNDIGLLDAVGGAVLVDDVDVVLSADAVFFDGVRRRASAVGPKVGGGQHKLAGREDRPHQFFRHRISRERLGQELGGAELASAGHDFQVRGPGDHDGRQEPIGGFRRTNPTQQRQTVDFRHQDIDHDQVNHRDAGRGGIPCDGLHVLDRGLAAAGG